MTEKELNVKCVECGQPYLFVKHMKEIDGLKDQLDKAKKEAEKKDKEIEELESYIRRDLELEAMLEKVKAIHRIELEKWKMWAERFSKVHNDVLNLSHDYLCRMQDRFAQTDTSCICGVNQVQAAFNEFQKFKESQDPKRCKHDVWASDHCYSCEKESKEKQT